MAAEAPARESQARRDEETCSASAVLPLKKSAAAATTRRKVMEAEVEAGKEKEDPAMVWSTIFFGVTHDPPA